MLFESAYFKTDIAEYNLGLLSVEESGLCERRVLELRELARDVSEAMKSLMSDGLSADEAIRALLVFDGEKILVQLVKTIDSFKKEKFNLHHDVREIKFFDKNGLCTCICADFTDKTLVAENHTDNIVKTAFGNNDCPDWNDFMDFLEERCLSKSRAGIREYLEAIGVSEYDPIEIIKKTAGRMAEDDQWIEMEAVK